MMLTTGLTCYFLSGFSKKLSATPFQSLPWCLECGEGSHTRCETGRWKELIIKIHVFIVLPFIQSFCCSVSITLTVFQDRWALFTFYTWRKFENASLKVTQTWATSSRLKLRTLNEDTFPTYSIHGSLKHLIWLTTRWTRSTVFL